MEQPRVNRDWILRVKGLFLGVSFFLYEVKVAVSSHYLRNCKKSSNPCQVLYFELS